MIHISNFDVDFKGKKFKDTSNGAEYICLGYGDCNNAPYFIGMGDGSVKGKSAIVRTVLFKNVEFVS